MTRTTFSVRTSALIGAAVVVLAAASTVGVAAASGAFRGTSAAPSGRCSAPALAGSVVDVRLTNMMNGGMGGSGSGNGNGSMSGGSMGLAISSTRATTGTVSFRVTNTGTLVHELVLLPLPPGQTVGARSVATNGKVDEAGSLGEASNNCASGPGSGLDPGGIGWITLQLSPGRYELICNLPGHYADGMYAELTVS